MHQPLTGSLHRMRTGKALKPGQIVRQCQELTDGLDQFVENTLHAVPGRRENFMLDREGGKAREKRSRHPEAALERGLYRQWGPASRPAGLDFLPKHCRWLQSFQVPLERPLRDPGWAGTDSEKKLRYGGWGDIDLLGVGPDYRPVVVELKADSAADPLHQVIVEGAAYALALKSMWNDPKNSFASEWAQVLKRRSVDINPKQPLGTIVVLCLAPETYWSRTDRMAAEAGSAIARLVDGFARHSIQIAMAELVSTARLRPQPPR